MNELINQYENKLFSVELSAQNVEQIISCIKCTMNELNKLSNSFNKAKIAELNTLLNYLESL